MVAASAAVITEVVERSSPRVRAIRAGFALAVVLVIITCSPFFKIYGCPCLAAGFHRVKDINLYHSVYSPNKICFWPNYLVVLWLG
jgi:hypothetical protein